MIKKFKPQEREDLFETVCQTIWPDWIHYNNRHYLTTYQGQTYGFEPYYIQEDGTVRLERAQSCSSRAWSWEPIGPQLRDLKADWRYIRDHLPEFLMEVWL